MSRKAFARRSAPISLADLKQGSGHALATATYPIKIDRPCRVHFHSKRHRLTDLDGLCGKYILDSIVTAGVLPDDRASIITQVSHTQERIAKDQKQETIVSFYEDTTCSIL